MLLSCQTNSNIIYSWFQERYAHIRYRLSNIKKEKNTVYFRCKISTAKTETISSRYFNPLRKSNFWQASQDFDPLFFQRFGAPSSSVLVVHAHDRKIPSRYALFAFILSASSFRIHPRPKSSGSEDLSRLS